MKKTALLWCILLSFGLVNAQKTQNLKIVPSQKYLNAGIELYDNGKFTEALEQYRKIPVGDTLYDLALSEIALTQFALEDYSGTVATCNEILSNPSCEVARFNNYDLLASSYDNLAQPDKAIDIYDKALILYPYNYQLHFNKGIVLARQKKYAEAIECFKKALFLNPAHQTSYYQYGYCNIMMGYTVPGLLALNYAILCNPSSRVAIQSLQMLNIIYNTGITLYNQDNDIVISPQIEEKNEFYAEIMGILNTTLAQSNKFQNESKIDHIVVKSNQIVFTHLQTRPNSYAIEDQLFVPLFMEIMKNKEFNTLCYYQLSGTDIDHGKVAVKAEKMSAPIQVLITKIVNHLQETANHGLGLHNEGDTTYRYDKLRLFSWGMLKSNGKNAVMEGEWHYINANGQLTQISNFKNDQHEGMTYLYENGMVSAELPMHEGAYHGEAHYYNVNPYTHTRIPSGNGTFENGVLNGLVQNYNRSGILIEENNFVNGKLEGEAKSYFDQGQLQTSNHYADNDYAGEQISYFLNGQTKIFCANASKAIPAESISYYPTGKIKEEGKIINFNYSDDYKTYYPNGNLKLTGHNNKAGEANGLFTRYYANKVIQQQQEFVNGKISSSFTEHDVNGKPLLHYTFKNNLLTTVTTLYPDSTVRTVYPVKNKLVTYDYYSANGILNSTITLSSNFTLEGINKYYYPNGQLRREVSFKNGQLEGIDKEWYPSGNLRSYVEYRQDKINGLSIYYNDNANNTIQSEARYKNDTLFGPCYNYNPDGSLVGYIRYNNRGQLVHSIDYLPNGQIKTETRYFNDLPFIITNYDQNEHLTHQDTIVDGNGTYRSYYLNGNVFYKVNLVAGHSLGTCLYYALNGQIRDSTNYINGRFNGLNIKFFDAFNHIVQKSDLLLGNLEGSSIRYEVNGNISSEQHFIENQLEGISKLYYLNGELMFEANHIDGSEEGLQHLYAPDGKTILLEMSYRDNNSETYSYRQQNGEMSKFLPIGNQPLLITAYYPNGKVGMVCNFDKGMKNGTRTLYYPNGQACKTNTFVNDDFEGLQVCYYPNGKIQENASCTMDEKNGTYQYYFDNGQLAYEGEYLYGQRHGEFKAYNNAGNLTLKRVYFYDNLIEETGF